MSTKKHLDTLLEIKDDPSLSQRSLAHKLNISLGLTNAILQNLIHRGWVKAQKMTGRKILYLITPKGMVQATNFIYDRVRETQHYYQYAKDLLATHFTNLYDKGVRMAVIYGTGQLAEIAYLSLLDSPLILYSILTDDSSKNKFLGHEVLTLPNFSQKISEIPNSESLIILSTVSQVENKILIIEIKKYKSLSQKIKIINIESILKDNQ
jgi:predicted transcriptional regulator